LLEADRLAILHPPDMDELGVQRAAGGLVAALVAAEDDDRITGVEHILGDHGEAVPFGADPAEHPGQHRFRTEIGIAVRIREILRLVPDDVRAHPRQHPRHVARAEGRVNALDQVDIFV
jgi:hypothetical protein